MTSILLCEYWIVEFLIMKLWVICLNLRNIWEKEHHTWIMRDWNF